MKKRLLIFSIVLIIILGLTNVNALDSHRNEPNEEGIYTVTLTGEYNYDIVKDVFNLVNINRENEGLNTLKLDNDLTEIAMIRARETAIYWSHTRPNGTTWSTLITNFRGYVGENIAVNYLNAEDVMTGWMNSQGHRDNILNTKWNSVGIGYYKIGNNIFWVQLFSDKSDTTDVEETGIVKTSGTVEILEDNINYNIVWETDPISLKINETISPKKIELTNMGYDKLVITSSKDDYVWKSSDTDIFTVDEEGVITGKKVGSAILTVSIGNITKEYPVSVSADLESIAIEKNLSLRLGETRNLTIIYKPENATIPSDAITSWTTSDPKVVTVQNGKITAIGLGTATITVKVGNKEATTEVTVRSATTGDVDGDNIVSAKDLMSLFRIVSKKMIANNDFNKVDINNNGTIDLKDIFYMMYASYLNR